MIALLAGFGCGLGLGGVYFGVMWATVQRIVTARTAGLLFLASYLFRLVIVGFGFYGVVRFWGAGGLVASLVGFLIVRHLFSRHMSGTVATRVSSS